MVRAERTSNTRIVVTEIRSNRLVLVVNSVDRGQVVSIAEKLKTPGGRGSARLSSLDRPFGKTDVALGKAMDQRRPHTTLAA